MKTKFNLVISLTLTLVFLSLSNLVAQNIAITDDDGYAANSAAMLDVKSTTKGLLIPRIALVSASDPISVTKPDGLLVWNTSTSGTYSNPGFYFWNGSDWEMVGSNNLFSNGLTQSGNTIKLGGSLTEHTVISQGAYNMTYNMTGSGDFQVLDNGSSAFKVNDDGNVGIGTSTPAALLDVNGDVNVEGNLTLTDNVLVAGSNNYRVYNNLVSYSGSSATGAIVINTNQPMQASMFRIKIEGSFYGGTGPFDITLKSYASSSSFGNYGYTSISPYDYDITLAKNTSTGNIAVIIGTTSTSFSFPKVTVTQFAQGYSTLNDDYASGWTISVETNLSGYQYQTLVPNVTAFDLSDYSTSAETAALIDAIDYFDRTGGHIVLEEINNNLSIGTTTETGKLLVQGTSSIVDTAIFEVKNQNGQTVFAVYPEGVRVYVDDNPSKAVGNKGGFAVGGFNSSKTPGLSDDYLIISRDSARIYYDAETSKAVGNKGGFAVGGFNSSKGLTATNFMDLSPLNYFIGHESGSAIETGGNYNTFFGYQSGKSTSTGDNNIFMGYQAGSLNSTGSNNTFLGYKAGYYNDIGSTNTYLGYEAGYESGISAGDNSSFNTFIGYHTGYNFRSGEKNVFLGHNAGYNTDEADYNVFIGTDVGYYNTTGQSNLFLGYQSGFRNEDGSFNTYMGYQAGFYGGYLVTDPNYNTMIGYKAGYYSRSGEYNTYLGYNAGYSTSGASGDNNVYIGHSTGYKNTTGHDNVFIGKQAGYDNTSGYNNVFLGLEAGTNNTTGYGNVFLGYQSGDGNTAGYKNTLVGQEAGQYNSTGDENVMLGYKAGYYGMGNQNIYIGCNTATVGGSGSTNVFIGYKSGEVFTGSRNVLIGPYTGYQHPDVLSDPNDKLCIGNSASWPPMIHGDFSTDDLAIYANVGIDEEPLSDSKLYVYTYDYQGYAARFRNDYNHDQSWGILIQAGRDDANSSGSYENRYIRFKDGDGSWMGSIVGESGGIRLDQPSDRRLKENIRDTKLSGLKIINGLRICDYNYIGEDTEEKPATVTGFIAQEAEKIYPKMVTFDDESGYYGVSQSTLIPVLTKAIQEQQELINQLEKRIKLLEQYNSENIKSK